MNSGFTTALLVMVLTTCSITTLAQNHTSALEGEAKQLIKEGNYKKAISIYSDLLGSTKDNEIKKTNLKMRGLLYDRLEMHDLAVTDFSQLLAMDRSDIAVFTYRGRSLMRTGDYEGAKKDYYYALANSLDGRMTEISYYWLARIHLASEEFNEAVETCDKYFEYNNKDPELHVLRGKAHTGLQDYTAAIEDYDKAINLDPSYASAYAYRGAAIFHQLAYNGNLKPSKSITSDACSDLNAAVKLGHKGSDKFIDKYCKKHKLGKRSRRRK